MIILFFPPLSNHKIQSSAVSPHLLKSSQVCKRLAGLKVSTLVQRSFELLHCQVKSAVLVSIKKYAVVITSIVKTIELGCYCFKCNAILYSMTCHLNKFPSSIHFMWSIYSIDVNIWNVKHTICYNTIYCIHTMACTQLTKGAKRTVHCSVRLKMHLPGLQRSLFRAHKYRFRVEVLF